MSKYTKRGWIGVDLDGTLVMYKPDYTKPFDPLHVGEPIPKMVEKVKAKLADGYEVRIVTARVSGEGEDGRDIPEVVGVIQAWCEHHLGAKLVVTCSKDYHMLELWDDRCKQVIPNTGEFLEDFIHKRDHTS